MKVRYFLPLSLLFVFFMWIKFIKPQIESEKQMNKKPKVLQKFSNCKIDSLDPKFSGDVYSSNEVAKVYEGLYEYHYLKIPYELTPNLAEDMPIISEDKLTYTIKIRKDVKFHDNSCFENGKGKILTAHDFIYSWKRLLDPKKVSRNAWILDDKIEGVNEWKQKIMDETANFQESISGIKAIDDYTLEIKLIKPCPQFTYFLAMVPSFVVSKEAVDHYKDGLQNHPIGTGPFVLENYNPNDNKIVYLKNKNYREKYFPKEGAPAFQHMIEKYAGKKIPFVDKVVTNIITEEQPRWLQFQKHKMDYIDIRDGSVRLEVLDEKNSLKKEYQEKGMEVFIKKNLNVGYKVFNTNNELLKNEKLRKAISLAIDRDKANEIFNKNRAKNIHTTIPEGFSGHDAAYQSPYGHYDLEKAKQLLKEAGYPGGKGLPEITYDISTTTIARKSAEFFQQCMQKIGVKIKIIQNIWPELVKKAHQGKTMIHSMAWSPDYPDAETFLSLFYGKSSSGKCYGNYDNAVYNSMYEKTATMEYGSEKIDLYKKMAEHIAENVPVILTLHEDEPILYHNYVKNLVSSAFHYGIEAYMDINLDEKEKINKK